jgi:hypothetical protein
MRIDKGGAMSLMTTAYLLEKYGPRLSVEQMAELLSSTPGAVRNAISADRFPLPTYLEGGRRWCDCRDAAEYFDRCRERARTPA